MKSIKNSSCLIAMLFVAGFANAQLDLSFNNPVNNITDSSRFDEGATINAVVKQADGKLLVAGEFSSYNGRPRKNFCRLMPDGSLDNDFIATSGFDREVNCIALQSDGKILVGGHFYTYNGQPASAIVRLNTDGSVDKSFNMGMGFYFGETNYSSSSGIVNTILVMPDGKILVGGRYVNYNGQRSFSLTRLNQDGTVDRGFQSGFVNGEEEVMSLAIHKGRILVGGRFNKYSGAQRNGFVKITMSGSIDIGFNLGGEGMEFETTIRSIAVQPDEKIVLVGRITKYNGNQIGNIVRLNENGWVDRKFFLSRFNTTTLYTTLIDEKGCIYVGGEFAQYHDVVRGGIIKLMPDGTPDKTALGTNIFSDVVVKSLVKTDDGNIIVAGRFSKLSYHLRRSIGIIDGDKGKIIASMFSPSWGFNGPVEKIIPLADGKYLLAGMFTLYNSRFVNNMMVVNEAGERDTNFLFPFYKYTLRSLSDVQVQRDGKILLAGELMDSDNRFFSLIRLKVDGTPDESFFTGGGFGRESVNAIQIQQDGKILVGGTFEKYDGVPVNGMVRLNVNGSIDNSFQPMLKTEVKKMLLDQSGNILVIGESRLNNEFVSNIIRYTPTGAYDKTFNPLKAGYSRADLSAIALQPDGKVLLGGLFAIANNERYEGIIRVGNDGMPDNAFKLDKQIAKCGARISVIKPLLDGKILVGFAEKRYEYGKENMLAMSVIKLSAEGLVNGQYLTRFGFGTGQVNNRSAKIIADLAVTSDNKILVAGSFSQVDEHTIFNLAKLNGEVFAPKEITVANPSSTNTPATTPKTNPVKPVNNSPANTSAKNTEANNMSAASGALNFFRQLNGKDPMDIRILDHPAIKPRVKKILPKNWQDQYQLFCEDGVTGEPIRVKGSYGYIDVMGKYNALGNIRLYLDLENDLIYVRFGSSRASDPPFVFGEKGAKKIPAKIEALF
ncbi:MAG: hypothetical protein GXC72_14310 [Chitinophagaceae bacterium]|nr:hypothetical protein [Chitinophagaceae bacterium]